MSVNQSIKFFTSSIWDRCYRILGSGYRIVISSIQRRQVSTYKQWQASKTRACTKRTFLSWIGSIWPWIGPIWPQIYQIYSQTASAFVEAAFASTAAAFASAASDVVSALECCKSRLHHWGQKDCQAWRTLLRPNEVLVIFWLS